MITGTDRTGLTRNPTINTKMGDTTDFKAPSLRQVCPGSINL